MASSNAICRIGVFYDGSFFVYAQRYYYYERDLGWLVFQPLHAHRKVHRTRGARIHELQSSVCGLAPRSLHEHEGHEKEVWPLAAANIATQNVASGFLSKSG
jgi:hypothetical protein